MPTPKVAKIGSVSPLDYTITLTRHSRCLVAGSPDLGFRIAPQYVEMADMSAEKVGRAVLTLLAEMDSRLQQMKQAGTSVPTPRAHLLTRQMLAPRDVARALGITTATVRKMVRTGRLSGERTPGGHLRIPADSLGEFIRMRESRTPALASAVA